MGRQEKRQRKKWDPAVVLEVTAEAERMRRANVPREEVLEKLESRLGDHEMAAAIYDFVVTKVQVGASRANHERVSGLYRFAVAGFILYLLAQGFRLLGSWVPVQIPDSSPATIGLCVVLVQGQWLLFRLSLRIIRAACFSVVDSLNFGSYPTKFHRPVITSSDQDMVRLKRMRQRVLEGASELASGTQVRSLVAEWSEVELTRGAAWVLALMAKVRAWTHALFPPYSHRPTSLVMAASVLLGGWLGISMLGERLTSAHQGIYLMCWAGTLAFECLRVPDPVRQTDAS